MARALKQFVVYAVVIVTALINAGLAAAFTADAANDGSPEGTPPATFQTLAPETPDQDKPDADTGAISCDGLCVGTTVPCGAACPLITATAATTAGLSPYDLLRFPVTARFSRGLEHDLDPGPPKTGV
ncbi:hypothetical protein [Algihabitans albus]|uniref:hypothetical protein n=1 Tax=Algihabitans albus TaxID=2164067 RepID=UPI000E5CF290|nr:hypothetical protein [Algihabitans albus]